MVRNALFLGGDKCGNDSRCLNKERALRDAVSVPGRSQEQNPNELLDGEGEGLVRRAKLG